MDAKLGQNIYVISRFHILQLSSYMSAFLAQPSPMILLFVLDDCLKRFLMNYWNDYLCQSAFGHFLIINLNILLHNCIYFLQSDSVGVCCMIELGSINADKLARFCITISLILVIIFVNIQTFYCNNTSSLLHGRPHLLFSKTVKCFSIVCIVRLTYRFAGHVFYLFELSFGMITHLHEPR